MRLASVQCARVHVRVSGKSYGLQPVNCSLFATPADTFRQFKARRVDCGFNCCALLMISESICIPAAASIFVAIDPQDCSNARGAPAIAHVQAAFCQFLDCAVHNRQNCDLMNQSLLVSRIQGLIADIFGVDCLYFFLF